MSATPYHTQARLHHVQMILKLNEYVHPRLHENWVIFRNFLGIYLSTLQCVNVRNVFNAFEILEEKGLIKLGEYRLIFQIFTYMGQQTCCSIIEKFTNQINSILGRRVMSSKKQGMLMT